MSQFQLLEVYSGLPQVNKMACFAKQSMIDVCESPEYTPVYLQILGKCEKIPKLIINNKIYLKELLSYQELSFF